MKISLLIIVVPATWIAAGAERTQNAARPQAVSQLGDWRRTVHGWERRSQWHLPRDENWSAATAVHPLVVAALQLLISLAALLLFPHPRDPLLFQLAARGRLSRSGTHRWSADPGPGE